MSGRDDSRPGDDPRGDDSSPERPTDAGGSREDADDAEPGDAAGAGSLVEREDGDGAWYRPPETSRRNVAKYLVGIAGSISV
ncbi:MAG: hypothetical protein ABEJ28_00265, partial [Salinigranum sp.]